MMTTPRAIRPIVPVLALLLALGQALPASAEGEGWSVIFTPQVFFGHIADNGFASPPPLGTFTAGNPHLITVNSQPTAGIDPQWGGQLGILRGNWTVGAAFQYVSFTTRNDVLSADNGNFVSQSGPIPPCGPFGVCFLPLPTGTTIVQEFVDTDRFDFELSLSYFVPDVVKDVLDINAGVGAKFIYATASRTFSNGVSPNGLEPIAFGYNVCDSNQLILFPASTTSANCQNRNRVSQDSLMYGVTFPVSLNFHLTQNKKWFLPVNVSPFLGAETRNDRNVVYATQPTTNPDVFNIVRQDGTVFAYGATADAGVRYLFDNGIGLYGGFRVQFYEGHNQFLAWGPVVNMSVRFGK
jgi:hypothetical protein